MKGRCVKCGNRRATPGDIAGTLEDGLSGADATKAEYGYPGALAHIRVAATIALHKLRGHCGTCALDLVTPPRLPVPIYSTVIDTAPEVTALITGGPIEPRRIKE